MPRSIIRPGRWNYTNTQQNHTRTHMHTYSVLLLFVYCGTIIRVWYVLVTIERLLVSSTNTVRRIVPRCSNTSASSHSSFWPAFFSGVIWGVGLLGQLLCSGNLGYTVAYPVTAIGPCFVSMGWSVLYFREIRGARNLSLILAAFLSSVVGLGLVAFTMSPPPPPLPTSNASTGNARILLVV